MWSVGVPFEFVGQITGSRTMAEASNVESCTTSSRHDERKLLKYRSKACSGLRSTVVKDTNVFQ